MKLDDFEKLDTNALARELYAFRIEERKSRRLPTTAWMDLSHKTQQYWIELIERVIELLPDPVADEIEDEGL